MTGTCKLLFSNTQSPINNHHECVTSQCAVQISHLVWLWHWLPIFALHFVFIFAFLYASVPVSRLTQQTTRRRKNPSNSTNQPIYMLKLIQSHVIVCTFYFIFFFLFIFSLSFHFDKICLRRLCALRCTEAVTAYSPLFRIEFLYK